MTGMRPWTRASSLVAGARRVGAGACRAGAGAGRAGRAGRRSGAGPGREPGAGDRAGVAPGRVGAGGKRRGADPENLTRREKAILVRGTSEAFGLPVAVLLARVGLARSTYFHQLRAMARPDRDEGLLALVREAFENSGRRYGYRRVWLELRGRGDRRVREEGSCG